ncbi:MAG TPA: hypothetical protein VFH80_19935 [Solirubrobacteraceae bacterium]|nr:hypothetical protein [Solirubrobacteraceae bacterium]
MNAPPEANSEYSRGSGASGRLLLPGWQPSETPDSPRSDAAGPARAAVALGALLGALLVIVAQFTALYHLHSATSSAAIKTVGTGGNHAWAPIPLALAAIALAYAVYRTGSRTALAGLVALGVATLLIALIGDLPDAHSSGLVGSSAHGYVQATSSPSAGLYMETLGAIILIVAGGIGLLMAAPQMNRRAT